LAAADPVPDTAVAASLAKPWAGMERFSGARTYGNCSRQELRECRTGIPPGRGKGPGRFHAGNRRRNRGSRRM